jgi:hypothetical protein
MQISGMLTMHFLIGESIGAGYQAARSNLYQYLTHT